MHLVDDEQRDVLDSRALSPSRSRTTDRSSGGQGGQDGGPTNIDTNDEGLMEKLNNIPPSSPPGQQVPMLWRRDDDVGAVQEADVRGALAGQHRHAHAEAVAKLLAPIRIPLLHEGLQGGDVDTPEDGISQPHVNLEGYLVIAMKIWRTLATVKTTPLAAGLLLPRRTLAVCSPGQHAQDSKLGTDRLATASGRAHERVVVCVVQRCEDLGLDRVEVRQAPESDTSGGSGLGEKGVGECRISGCVGIGCVQG